VRAIDIDTTPLETFGSQIFDYPLIGEEGIVDWRWPDIVDWNSFARLIVKGVPTIVDAGKWLPLEKSRDMRRLITIHG
jgi:hypothetical protein